MTSESRADLAIASLRAHHDRMSEVAAGLADGDLEAPSAAEGWTVAQVFSHLGSGAEITGGTILGALGEPGQAEPNESVWSRWNAMSPQEQVDGFLAHDERFVATLEATSADKRAGATVDLGFLPEPVPLHVALGMRLNEVALHSWDVLAASDPAATVDDDAAEILLAHYAGPASFMLGFIGKSDRLDEATVVDLDGYHLVIDDGVRLGTGSPERPTATFDGRHEAALRLFTGRLKEGYTGEEITVTGNVTLEDLRRVFPGY